MNDDAQRFQNNLTDLHRNSKVSNLKITHNTKDPSKPMYQVEANGPQTTELRDAISQMTKFINEKISPNIPTDLQDSVHISAGQLRIKLDYQNVFRHLHSFNRKDLVNLRDRITSKSDANRLIEEALLAADQEARANISLIENEISVPLDKIGLSTTYRHYPSPATLILKPISDTAKKTD